MVEKERHGNGTDSAAKPHVFVEQDVPSMAMLAGDNGRGFVPAGSPLTTASVCGLCRKPRGDRVHVEGRAEADSESSNWG